ncbi:MAG: MerR family transcriptional regulator, partial [Solirubrobacterales bacterium]
RPMKRRGGRRYYRPEDVVLLREVRRLLYVEGYTIRGVQKLLRQQSRRALARPPMRPEGAEEGEWEEPDDEAVGEEASASAAAAAPGLAEAAPLTPLEAAAEAAAPSQPPKWRRDMEMSTVLRKELYTLLCELEELRALLPTAGREPSDD